MSYQLNYIYNSPQTHEGVRLDHLEPSRISFKTFGKIPQTVPLRISYDSYIGILRPFGTISEVFGKSSAEDSVIPCFPESDKN